VKIGKSPRGRWKIPETRTPDGRICWCINWPDDPEHTAILWGMLEDLTRRYNWGEPLTEDSQTVAEYYRQIVDENRACFEAARAMGNRGCGSDVPDQTRINENGLIEVSFDDGQTWSVTDADPRFNSPIFPPLFGPPGPDLRCSGALSGREFMRLSVEYIATNTALWQNIFALIAGLIGMLSSLFPIVGTIVVGIITAIAMAIFAFGRAAFEAAMTSTVLDTYKCILFCNIEDDASFTSAGWQGVKQDVVSQLDGIPEAFFWNMTNSLGPVGLTNACRSFPGLAGSCSTCGCQESCTDIWVIEGDVVSDDGETIIINSVFVPERNRHEIAWEFGLPNIGGGCCYIQTAFVSGGWMPGNVWYDCEGNTVFNPLVGGQCWKAMQIWNDVGGTGQFTLKRFACPP